MRASSGRWSAFVCRLSVKLIELPIDNFFVELVRVTLGC